ncbi:hypothetical protein GQ54DRAFT_317624 [Martensiomyces pterosporus]|nr:hypothetical protein GQ54DRAFT_317624 [Martensiomyces pterosporus]
MRWLQALCFFFSLPNATLHDRDHPRIIGLRIRGAILATSLSILVTGGVLSLWQPAEKAGVWAVVDALGLSPKPALASVAIALVLSMTLYLGPLVLDKLDGVFKWESVRRIPGQLRQPMNVRNYIAGPLTEELVFRSSVVPLWVAAGLSAGSCIFLSPLIFGVAHVHHAVSVYANGRVSLANVLMGTAFQLAYTTLFGWFAVFLFIRTGSVAGPIVAHAFCNVEGLPDLSRAQEHPRYKYAIWLAFVSGAVGFLMLLEPMTRPGVFVS